MCRAATVPPDLPGETTVVPPEPSRSNSSRHGTHRWTGRYASAASSIIIAQNPPGDPVEPLPVEPDELLEGPFISGLQTSDEHFRLFSGLPASPAHIL